MSDSNSNSNSAHKRRAAQNRKSQQAYREREASRAARMEPSRRNGPDESRDSVSNEAVRHPIRNGQQQSNTRGQQAFEFVFQQHSPGLSSSTNNEWLTNCMQHLQQPNATCDIPSALESEDFLVFPPPNGFQSRLPSSELQQQQLPEGFGQTALHLAAAKNFAPVCQRLIRYGAALEAREEGNGRTPLHMAALCGFVEVVTVLIAGGALVSAEDTAGMTPLCLAVSSGHEAVVEVLLSSGADPNQRV